MKKTTKKSLKILLISVLVLSALAFTLNWAFFDLQRIDGETFLSEVTSPGGTYTAKAYVNNGGATTSYAVLAVLENNVNGKHKNIYWEYRMEKADMKWIDEETININGVVLNVKKDVYDFRK